MPFASKSSVLREITVLLLLRYTGQPLLDSGKQNPFVRHKKKTNKQTTQTKTGQPLWSLFNSLLNHHSGEITI